MNKKSNKKLMAGLIVLITLIIIGITCSGFLDNFKEGIKFLGISFGISAGLVLLLFIMKYIIKGADKLLGEGRTFNDRAIVLFSILILVSLTCRGFLKNFTLGIVFLIVSIVFVSIAFLIMYGINSKKGEIKKVILAEKTSGEKMFILLTVLILVSLTCGGFIQNLKAGILFLIISIISSLALYLTVTEVKNENSIIGKIIRIETTFNQKMIILLSTITMVSLTCGGFLKNLRAGIVFLMISIIFTTSMLMLVLGVKSKHKIYDKIAGFETTLNEKMIILLATMAMVSITSGGFLYNFKLGMLFLTISLIFSGLVLAGVISVRPRVNIFKMRARIQNLGKKEAIRAFGMIFACVFVTYTLSSTWAYFTNKELELTENIQSLKVVYSGNSYEDDNSTSGSTTVGYGTGKSTLYEALPGDVVIHYLNMSNVAYNDQTGDISGGTENAPFLVPYLYVFNDTEGSYPTGTWHNKSDSEPWNSGGAKMTREDSNYCWYSYVIKSSDMKSGTDYNAIVLHPDFVAKGTTFDAKVESYSVSGIKSDSNIVKHYYIIITGYNNATKKYTTKIIEDECGKYNNEIGTTVEKVRKSLYVYYFVPNDNGTSNIEVTATKTGTSVTEARTQKLVKVDSSDENYTKLNSDIGGTWYVTEGQVDLGMMSNSSETKTNLKFTKDGNTLETVNNVVSDKDVGGKVFVRGGASYQAIPEAVNRSIKVYYYGTASNVTASINGITLSGSFANSTDPKWQMVTLNWNKIALEQEKVKVNLNIDSVAYEYYSSKSNDEIWIKNGEAYDSKPPEYKKLTINYYSKNFAVKNAYTSLGNASNPVYNSNNGDPYYTFTINFIGNPEKIDMKIEGDNSNGTKQLKGIPLVSEETYDNVKIKNNYLDSDKDKDYLGNITIRSIDSEGNITIDMGFYCINP